MSEHSLLEVALLQRRGQRAGPSGWAEPAPASRTPCGIPAPRAAARALLWPHDGTRCQKFVFQTPTSPIPGGLGVPVQFVPLLSLRPSGEAQELLFRASVAVNVL